MRSALDATLPAIVNSHVENFAPGTYRFRARYTRRKHLLGQILRQIPLPNQVRQQRHQSVLVAQHQLFECLRIAIAHL